MQCTLYDTLCCHAMIPCYDLLFQRSAVHADTDRDISLLCHLDDRAHTLLAPNVSRIDPDLVCTRLHRRDCQPVVKMNICHKRNRDLFLDLAKSFRCFLRRNRTADDVTARLCQLLDLRCRCSHVLGLCICHRLNKHRISTSDDPIADHYCLCMIPVHFFLPFYVFGPADFFLILPPLPSE